MSGAKDPAFKLFGTTIQQARSEDSMGASTNSSSEAAAVIDDCDSNRGSTVDSSAGDCNTSAIGWCSEVDKNLEGKTADLKKEDGGPTMSSEEIVNPDGHSSIEENSNALSCEETSASKSSKHQGEQNEMNDSQEETPKKPDNIIPCPHCISMETKFCYFNNYNVSQPRHFYKKCQRYWTAGGTVRNMPIGAGRRKNKTSASLYHHLTVSEAGQNRPTALPHGFQNPLWNLMPHFVNRRHLI